MLAVSMLSSSPYFMWGNPSCCFLGPKESCGNLPGIITNRDCGSRIFTHTQLGKRELININSYHVFSIYINRKIFLSPIITNDHWKSRTNITNARSYYSWKWALYVQLTVGWPWTVVVCFFCIHFSINIFVISCLTLYEYVYFLFKMVDYLNDLNLYGITHRESFLSNYFTKPIDKFFWAFFQTPSDACTDVVQTLHRSFQCFSYPMWAVRGPCGTRHGALRHPYGHVSELTQPIIAKIPHGRPV